MASSYGLANQPPVFLVWLQLLTVVASLQLSRSAALGGEIPCAPLSLHFLIHA